MRENLNNCLSRIIASFFKNLSALIQKCQIISSSYIQIMLNYRYEGRDFVQSIGSYYKKKLVHQRSKRKPGIGGSKYMPHPHALFSPNMYIILLGKFEMNNMHVFTSSKNKTNPFKDKSVSKFARF